MSAPLERTVTAAMAEVGVVLWRAHEEVQVDRRIGRHKSVVRPLYPAIDPW